MIKRLFIILSILFIAYPCFALNNVYYSVSPFGTGDIKIACNISISGGAGVAIFSVAQTDNIGVGCHVISSGVDGYISVMTNSTTATIVTALGVAHGNISSEGLTSIAHEYASLSAAEAGASDASHINNASLVSADVVLNIPCYYDHDDDTVDGAASISGYTTDATRSIEIYTPQGGTEAINNQRHNGIYTSESNGIQAYRLESSSDVLAISDGSVNVNGIQIQALTSGGIPDGIRIPAFGGAAISIVNTIIKREATNKSVFGIEFFGGPNATTTNVINCIIDGFKSFSGARGIIIGDADHTVNILNCTIYDNYIGIAQITGTAAVTNTAVGASNSTADDFVGTITIDYCASDAGDGTNAQTLDSTSNYVNEFSDVINGDFSLVSGGICIGNGTDDPGSGLYSDDIIGVERSSTWDIGAFEFVAGAPSETTQVIFIGQLMRQFTGGFEFLYN